MFREAVNVTSELFLFPPPTHTHPPYFRTSSNTRVNPQETRPNIRKHSASSSEPCTEVSLCSEIAVASTTVYDRKLLHSVDAGW